MMNEEGEKDAVRERRPTKRMCPVANRLRDTQRNRVLEDFKNDTLRLLQLPTFLPFRSLAFSPRTQNLPTRGYSAITSPAVAGVKPSARNRPRSAPNFSALKYTPWPAGLFPGHFLPGNVLSRPVAGQTPLQKTSGRDSLSPLPNPPFPRLGTRTRSSTPPRYRPLHLNCASFR